MDTFNYVNKIENLTDINSKFYGITLAIESIDDKYILTGK
jgi:hypothetical protein